MENEKVKKIHWNGGGGLISRTTHCWPLVEDLAEIHDRDPRGRTPAFTDVVDLLALLSTVFAFTGVVELCHQGIECSVHLLTLPEEPLVSGDVGSVSRKRTEGEGETGGRGDRGGEGRRERGGKGRRKGKEGG